MTEVFVATTVEQARLLLDIPMYGVLGAVLRGPISASDAARSAHIPLKRAHAMLTRLLRAGLIEVAGERPRGGRPVKLYRAVAKAYRVPFSLTDAATSTELVRAMQAPFVAAYSRSLGALLIEDAERDLLIRLGDRGELEATVGETERFRQGAHGVLAMTEVRLSAGDAAELERRLHELRVWAGERRQPAGGGAPADAAPYLLGLLLSPGSLREP